MIDIQYKQGSSGTLKMKRKRHKIMNAKQWNTSIYSGVTHAAVYANMYTNRLKNIPKMKHGRDSSWKASIAVWRDTCSGHPVRLPTQPRPDTVRYGTLDFTRKCTVFRSAVLTMLHRRENPWKHRTRCCRPITMRPWCNTNSTQCDYKLSIAKK